MRMLHSHETDHTTKPLSILPRVIAPEFDRINHVYFLDVSALTLFEKVSKDTNNSENTIDK